MRGEVEAVGAWSGACRGAELPEGEAGPRRGARLAKVPFREQRGGWDGSSWRAPGESAPTHPRCSRGGLALPLPLWPVVREILA